MDSVTNSTTCILLGISVSWFCLVVALYSYREYRRRRHQRQVFDVLNEHRQLRLEAVNKLRALSGLDPVTDPADANDGVEAIRNDDRLTRNADGGQIGPLGATKIKFLPDEQPSRTIEEALDEIPSRSIMPVDHCFCPKCLKLGRREPLAFYDDGEKRGGHCFTCGLVITERELREKDAQTHVDMPIKTIRRQGASYNDD